MIQVGVLLSFSGNASVTERSHHRAVCSTLFDHSLPQLSSSAPAVELIVRDMQSSPAVCVAQVTQLAQRGIKIFLGIVTAACLRAIRPILDQYNCLLFGFTPFEATILPKHDRSVRLRPVRVNTVTSPSACDGYGTNACQHHCSLSLLLDTLAARQPSPVSWLGYLGGNMYAASQGHTISSFIADVCRHIHRDCPDQPNPASHLGADRIDHLEQVYAKPRAEPLPFPAIQTNSPRFQVELRSARIAAHSLTNTLLVGETGAGKEVLARAIHSSSARKTGPFVSVNIAALPRELVASELFGYGDGAFTGAKKGGQIGKFEAANGGTLFLDEIGELPLDQQVVLLRVLEERKVTKLGDHVEKPLDVRIIAATNRVLEEEVSNGRFRADLYYRLNVLPIRIPPLRERKEDIAPLAETFLKQLHAQYGTGPLDISSEAQELLIAHAWPGNIRELRNVMERAFLLAIQETLITPAHLPMEWHASRSSANSPVRSVPLLRDMERQTIRQALASTASLSAAAKKLGIARSTLYRKMAELEMG